MQFRVTFFAIMSSSDIGSPAPQFQTVEYEVKPDTCFLCNQPIAGAYYRVNGEQACANCAERQRTAQNDSAKHYSRALIFGIGAAIVGMIGYAIFAIVTGIVIGYLSLGVGWLIAKAMLKGSQGFGGRKYQITAVLLTYMAVSTAAIPIAISLIVKQKKEQHQVQLQQKQPSISTAAPTNDPSSSNDPNSAAVEAGKAGAPGTTITLTPDGNVETQQPKPEPKMSLGRALGALLFYGLASPFFDLKDPFHGIIGLIILFVGMQIAWKMMARPTLIIDGPF